MDNGEGAGCGLGVAVGVELVAAVAAELAAVMAVDEEAGVFRHGHSSGRLEGYRPWWGWKRV